MSTIEPEHMLHTETVYSGKLISVRKDTVQLPGGKQTEREVVVHPETIAVIPVLDDGRIVMVRQYRYSAGRTMLELPAGGIDRGETADEAARREMKEETGYEVGETQLLTSFYTSPGFTTELMHLFLARQLTPGRPTEPTDQIEVQTLTLDDALSKMTHGDIVDAKTILGLLWYAREIQDA